MGIKRCNILKQAAEGFPTRNRFKKNTFLKLYFQNQ